MTETNSPSPKESGDDRSPTQPNDELHGLDPKNMIAQGLQSDPSPSPMAGFAWQPPEVEELTLIFPRFQIIELLGRGGMGAVYKARQTGLDRLVAIKVLPPQASEDVQFAERFSREAKALAMLNHPHIVAVHDFGEAEGMFYIVMEFVDGSDLRGALKAGNISPLSALKIVPQICDALHYAHAKGLVHRDIKPENILLDVSGNVKIADFGLARLLGSKLPEWTLTATEQVMGTLKYMAPEQVEGTKDIDHRADIYSLGVVFYEMLTGELPIGRFASPSKKSSVDERVDDVVFKTLEKAPADRYQDASAVKTDVENLSREPPPVPGIDYPLDRLAEGSASPQTSDAKVALPTAELEEKPKLSKRAVIGAIWALMGIPALLVLILYFVPGAMVASSPTEWHGPHDGTILPLAQSFGLNFLAIGIGLILLVLGISSAIGTPIMGRLAIRDIHFSKGKLFGLRLALADLLLHPLLIVDLLILTAIMVIAGFVPQLIFDRGFGRIGLSITLLVAVVIVVVIDFFVIHWAWRKYRLRSDTGKSLDIRDNH